MNPFTLRTLRAQDAVRLLKFEQENRHWFEHHIDPRAAAFYTPEGVHEHIEQALDAYARGTWHPCVLVDPDGAIIGRANLKDIDPGAGTAEVGYRIAQGQAGKGLATAAVRQLIGLASAQWQLERLLAYVTSANAASVRVLERCGFIRGDYVKGLATVGGIAHDGHAFSFRLGSPAELPSALAAAGHPPARVENAG